MRKKWASKWAKPSMVDLGAGFGLYVERFPLKWVGGPDAKRKVVNGIRRANMHASTVFGLRIRDRDERKQVLVQVASREEANNLLNQGFRLGPFKYSCSKPGFDNVIVPCSKCQSPGHRDRTCDTPSPTCGNCSGIHDTRSCNNEHLRCSYCGGNHSIMSAACLVYQRSMRVNRILTVEEVRSIIATMTKISERIQYFQQMDDDLSENELCQIQPHYLTASWKHAQMSQIKEEEEVAMQVDKEILQKYNYRGLRDYGVSSFQ